LTVDHEPETGRGGDAWTVDDYPERKYSPEEVLLADADWGFPRFTFQRVDDGRRAPAPMHLDLTPEDRVQAVARLTELGRPKVPRTETVSSAGR